MPDESTSRLGGAIVDATIVSRSPSVLTAEVDGEIVKMSIGQDRYFGLNDIGSDYQEKMTVPAGGNKSEWFKRYGSNEVPEFFAAHVDRFIVCAFGAI
jgi:hypothetical protein